MASIAGSFTVLAITLITTVGRSVESLSSSVPTFDSSSSSSLSPSWTDRSPSSSSSRPPRVIYESDRVLAVSKPPHVSHHDDGDGVPGVLSLVRASLENASSSSRYRGRLWGVHRLDRVTSGVLLFAKSRGTAQELARAFAERRVTKYYLALTDRRVTKKKQGWVRGDMAPSRRKTRRLLPTTNDPAVTRFFTAGLGNCDRAAWETPTSTASVPRTMVLFRPHTGRTHQLRVAAKSLSLPVLGDADYGNAAGRDRTYLHALATRVELRGDDGEEEDVVVYDPPNDWFSEGDGMREVMENLMRKHCDCEELLRLL